MNSPPTPSNPTPSSESRIPFSARALRWWALHGLTSWDRHSAFRKLRRYHRGLSTTVTTTDGFFLNVTVGDSVDSTLFVRGEFEPAIARWVRARAPQARTFVDVGCNLGYYSCLFSRYCSPGAKVLALDANPLMAERCRDNMAMNGYQGQVLAMGVADRVGEQIFYLQSGRPSKGSFGKHVRDDAPKNVIDVPVAPLPKILQETGFSRVDLMKVDIEGYEPALFKGLSTADYQRFGSIIFEYEPSHMKRCGFTPDDLWNLPLWAHYQLSYLGIGIDEPKPFKLPTLPTAMTTVIATQNH